MKRLHSLLLALGLILALSLPSRLSAVPVVANNNALTATTVQLIAGPVTINYWNMSNPNTALVFVQFFDAASIGSVTLGTTVPKFVISVPAFGGVIDTSFVTGFVFVNGVVAAATTTPTGNTAPSSNGTIPVKSP